MFTDDIVLHGKHAQYVKELGDSENKLFNRYLDVFMNSAVIGLIFDKREVRDKESQYKDTSISIFAAAINKEKANLDYIYRLIMLLDDSGNIDLEGRINRAFRDDANSDVSDRHQKNLELFKEYALGGITILYDKIIKEGITKEDFMKNSYEFMKSRSEEIEEGAADELIDAL
ncbi:hypothetical protein Plano_2845 [Planococcus sp. PAMC 21323]|uniref:hypothetical protein n=1 Tax=Planococcus sp. PAMC 21323 TaxID=1526927 RepID=UPI00056E7BC7|nr:hypothetical protein [Planococcus sp. PAMC 21323]AIY06810.1 hypothetical protein Plano_2845 [Planococcus sp. PAMC 21323]